MARIPGLVAHAYDEKTGMKLMRHINSKEHGYDGTAERGFDCSKGV
jgi:citrate synthase